MSSKILQRQRIDSLLLKELHKFVGDPQAGGQGMQGAVPGPSEPRQPGMQGGTGSVGASRAPAAA